MFLLNSSFDFTSHADNNTPYISGPIKDLVKTESEISGTWFRENHIKIQIIVTSLLHLVRIKDIGGHIIYNITEEKLRGIKIDLHSQPLFVCLYVVESHVSTLSKRASQKLHALSRITSYMDLEKLKCLLKTSQFNYCLPHLDVS